jgi:6-phospho-3-hexuloisomerase
MNAFNLSLQEIIDNLKVNSDTVDMQVIEKIADEIIARKRVFVYGAGRSGLVAKAFAQRLMHIGIESYVIGETINPSVKPGNIVLLVSGSGETTSSVAIGDKAKKVGALVISVTTRPDSSLARLSDIVLQVSGKTKLMEKKGYAPFTSLFDTACLAILDSIAALIMEKLGIDESVIAERHANVE